MADINFPVAPVDDVDPDVLELMARMPEQDEAFIGRLRVFGTYAVKEQDIVYYPNGAEDVSPLIAFPQNRIIFVEHVPHDDDYDETIDPVLILKKQQGIELYDHDPETFLPGDVNVVIMHNSQIPPGVFEKFLKKDGYLVCDNFYKTADYTRENQDFDLIGVVTQEENEYIFIQEGLDDFFVQVSTDKEFEGAQQRKGEGYITYERVADLVDVFDIKSDSILGAYAQLENRAKELQKQRKENGQFANEEDAIQRLLDVNEDLYLTDETNYNYIISPLPPKRGVASDLFVFKKRV